MKNIFQMFYYFLRDDKIITLLPRRKIGLTFATLCYHNAYDVYYMGTF